MNFWENFRNHLGQTSAEPMGLDIVDAEGVYLIGRDGKKYIDLISGIAVSHVGHKCPEVVAAVQAQAGKYLHAMVYGEFVLQPQVEYATELAEALGHRLNRVFFVNSGSEAVEGALKLAKKFTGRRQLMGFWNSYHGSTHGALSVTGAPDRHWGYGPLLPDTAFLRFNRFDDLQRITQRTAAVIVEPIQGEAGVRLPAEGFLQALQARCREVGALLITDECQTGFGRAGALFAHQKFGIEPDILLLGKALGGGMPLGAFIARGEIMDLLQDKPVLGHISTFGGHAVCCAAGLAAFRKVKNERLIDAVPAKEAIIRQKLQHPAIKEVRGAGLMYAVQLESFSKVKTVIGHCLEAGVITDWFLHESASVRLAPPLTIREAELADALDRLLAAVEHA